jgi:hypothetical protein
VSHTTDWFPGRISKAYKTNYDEIFLGNREEADDDNKRLNEALKAQRKCCSGSCNCSMPKLR